MRDMSETQPQPELEQNFSAYYGTTMENFLVCAQVDEQGKVVFAKKQEQKHVEPEATQFVCGLVGGANYAVTRARELGHTPLVLEGELDKQKYYNRQELFPGEAFPVTNVWVPQEGIDWKKYNPFADNFDPDVKETKRVFQPKNPKEVLDEHIKK